MRRAVLPLVTLGLFAMVLADRLSHALSSDASQPAVQGPNDTRSATSDPRAPGPSENPAASAGQRILSPSTPTIDRLARLAARQQLSRSAGLTYLDSLIISTDSLVRRWPDRSGV